MTYVKVVELQLGQAAIQGLLNNLGAVLAVPQLGSNEQVLTLQTGDVLVGTLDTGGNLTLVLVAI